MIITGLDVSTKFGWATVDFTDPAEPTLLGSGVIVSKERGMVRAIDMGGAVIDPELVTLGEEVIIEGYGFANKHSLGKVVEVGTMIRYTLMQRGIPYIEVPPKSLKKFVTGNGNAGKDIMMLEVYKRWGISTDSNDIADAVGLAYFGAALHGLIEMPKSHMIAVDNVRKEVMTA